MFILSKNKNAYNTILSYKKAFEKSSFQFGDIYQYDLSTYTLYWFSARPQDQLYVYKNGFIIGKRNFEDDYCQEPIQLHENLPVSTASILQNTIIRCDREQLIIEPNETTSIYYDENYSVADYSILLAKLNNRLPSHLLVQILAAIGYFPGNLTLFEGVERVPYLYGIDLNKKALTKLDDFKLRKSDDDKMLARLKGIVPQVKKQSLAMSGGLDSRFVLGVLLSQNIKPTLRSLKDKENPIVEKLNEKLNLKFITVEGEYENAYHYTLMTDGRIYFRGGNYSKLYDEVSPNEFLHTGLSILPMNENSFASAWKKPGSIKNIYNDLIHYALLPRMPKEGFKSFVKPITKHSSQAFLEDELAYGKNYSNFKTRKQWALWFYHLNRGLTWTYAHVQDLSFYVYPIFILGDKKAAEWGITSSAYSNFNKERLRRINQKLFPDLPIDYSDNRDFNSKPFILDHYDRIYNEYFKKLVNRFKQLKTDHSTHNHNWFEDIDYTEAPSFNVYFKDSYKNIVNDRDEIMRVRRTAVTLNNVLLYLES